MMHKLYISESPATKVQVESPSAARLKPRAPRGKGALDRSCKERRLGFFLGKEDMNRRDFLKGSAAGAVTAAAATRSLVAAEKGSAPKRKPRLGLSSYSYWHFKPPKVSIE